MNKVLFRLMSVVLSLSLTLGIYFNANAAANTYYVSATGNDANAGTSSAPFKTLQKAATRAVAGDTIVVLAGSYTGTNTITLKGSPSAPITIAGDGAVFDGGSLVLKNSEWLVLQGLTFRNTVDEVTVLSSHYLTFKSNVFDFTHAGILIKEYSSHLVIENNEFYQSCAMGKTWTQLKDSTCEGGAVYGSSYGGGTYYIRNNWVHDVFNGFLFTDDTAGKWMNSNVFIHNNRFERVVDDPAEPEGDSFNFHVYGNTMVDTHRMTSVTTSGVGPVFIYNNVQITKGNPTNEASRLNSAFKVDLSNGYANGLWIFNNTIVGDAAANFSAYDMLSRTVSSPWTVRNNIYVTAIKAFNKVPAAGSFDYDISKAPFGITEPNGKVADALLATDGRLLPNSPAIGKGTQVSIPSWFASSVIVPAGANLGAFQTIPAPMWVLPPDYPSQIPANIAGWPNSVVATPLPVTVTATVTTQTPTQIPTLVFTPTSTPLTVTPTASPTVTAANSPTATATKTAEPTITSQPTVIPVTPVSNGGNSVDVRVANGNDDVEESSSGGISSDSGDLELIYDTSPQAVGIRFTGVNIPRGAIITNAYLQFKADETNSKAISLTIFGEASGNAAAFANTARNVSSRARTANSVTWAPPAWSKRGEMGTGQRTPNLNAIVQEIVNQTNWNPGNSIVMVVMGNNNNKRVAKSFEGNSAGAPLLHVEFSMPAQVAMAMASTPTPTPTATLLTPLASPTLMPAFTLEPTQVLPSPTTAATETPTPTPIPPTPTVEVFAPTETPTPPSSDSSAIEPALQAANKLGLANENPVITSSGSFSIVENTTAVTTITATDAQTLTYSIVGGVDLALFSINTSTGELTFIVAPDFEVLTDAGADNIYNVTVLASDGELGTTQDIVVTVTAANDNIPVITSNGSLLIVENTTAVTTVTATDVDLPAPVLTYSIAGGADSVLFSINASTGELAFITAPDFEIPTDAGADNVYNVTFQASDGTLVATQDVVVTVSAANDNTPAITSTGSFSIVENTTAVTLVTATDADLPAQALAYSIVGGADLALFNINASTGELAFITAPDFEVPTDAGMDNIYNVTVQASDGEFAVTQDIIVTVTSANDNTPVITSNGSLSIVENTTAVMAVTATDADLPAQALAYSIVGGVDSVLFSINTSTGELTFIVAPDFEVPTDAGADNIYNVTVQASDGELAITQDVVVAVTAANDNTPVITSNGSHSIVENTTAVTVVTATDVDLPAQALTYSIVGGVDSVLFSINSSTGELTFIAAPDFEVPTDVGADNVYNVTVQAFDGELSATQDMVIAVTAANDNTPVITSNGSLSIVENTTAVTVVTATDADLPAQALTYSIVGGTDSMFFSINSSTGELTFIAAPDFEVPTDAGMDNIYNVTVQVSDGTFGAKQNIAVAVKGVDQPR